jgi:protein-disulfide isomerase-like protein with CxxC motif
VTPVHTKPVPPPRKPAPEPATETASEQSSKPAPPQILPQLSAGDQLAYQRQTEEDIKAAESNLQQASGKQLSAAQSDLVQKIQSFLSDSRAASKEGDWSRAQQLSQKARRVSDELVASF